MRSLMYLKILDFKIRHYKKNVYKSYVSVMAVASH